MAALLLVVGLAGGLQTWRQIRQVRAVVAQDQARAANLSAELGTLGRDPAGTSLQARIAALQARITAMQAGIPTQFTSVQLVSAVMDAGAREGVQVQSVVVGTQGPGPDGLVGTNVAVQAVAPTWQAATLFLYELEHGPFPAVAPLSGMNLGGGQVPLSVTVTFYSRDGISAAP